MISVGRREGPSDPIRRDTPSSLCNSHSIACNQLKIISLLFAFLSTHAEALREGPNTLQACAKQRQR